jgi:hypothetical protein
MTAAHPPIVRDYPAADILDTERGDVAHLSGRHDAGVDSWGAWYSMCGRVVPSWRKECLSDTEHSRVCASCAGQLARRSRPRRGRA